MTVDLRLHVDGGRDADVALWEWLRAEPELRGLVTREPPPAPAGAMGAAADVVVALTATGTVAATARAVGRAVEAWIGSRTSTVTLTVTADELTITGDRIRAEDLERLVRAAQAAREAPSGPAAGTDPGPG